MVEWPTFGTRSSIRPPIIGGGAFQTGVEFCPGVDGGHRHEGVAAKRSRERWAGRNRASAEYVLPIPVASAGPEAHPATRGRNDITAHRIGLRAPGYPVRWVRMIRRAVTNPSPPTRLPSADQPNAPSQSR